MRRPWLSRELDYLAAHAGHTAVAVMARRLGRSRASVVGALVYRRLSRRKARRADWEPVLRRLHAAGLTDVGVATRTGWTRHTARRRRLVLGLPPNPLGPGESRARYRKAMATAEAGCLADLRYRPQRVARLLNGEG